MYLETASWGEVNFSSHFSEDRGLPWGMVTGCGEAECGPGRSEKVGGAVLESELDPGLLQYGDRIPS